MSSPSIYTVGGTVQAGSGLYVSRKADEELLARCQAGTFAYVLTARQMGKSSLMVRTAEQLARTEIRSVVIDLTSIGDQVTPEEWYFGLLTNITDQLDLQANVVGWWQEHAHLGVTQRMPLFLEKVLLKEVTSQVVIFIDEIDSTLGLPFTDDFYAAIRFLYNTRARTNAFRRISFVLVGVATPSDLIRDSRRTPFNIGDRVELTDFTLVEALPLATGLGQQPGKERELLRWLLKWTGGHPYLTQRLCREVAEKGRNNWSEIDVEEIVTSTFFGDKSVQEHNLLFVRDMLTKQAPDRPAVLQTYWDIRRGRRVPDEEQSLVKSHLKLSGVVRREKDYLVVRNPIYQEVFNQDWIQAQNQELANQVPSESAETGKATALTPSIARDSARMGVFISGTVRDLPEHRKQVLDACLRMGMFPHYMEHLPSSDTNAIAVSLQLVDSSDIFLAVIAHRYGYVPVGYNISLTEMEFNRAKERGIPCLIFIMDDNHPTTKAMVETEAGALKLRSFKERLMNQEIINFFGSPEDLHSRVLHSLSQIRRREVTSMHYMTGIPAPPEPYIVHPYTLLQTGQQLIGRQDELNLLTAWVADASAEVFQAHLVTVVALGGMGKSALSWKWFNDIAPQVMEPLAGRFWWSFYESGAHFENFLVHVLAYVTGRAREDIQKMPRHEREIQLLIILEREPFLLVMDGLECILNAYNVAKEDSDGTAVGARIETLESTDQLSTDPHALRKTADPGAGAFLRKLARVQAGRILVSSRLAPADLETVTGQPISGSFVYSLAGLNSEQSLELWRSLGVSGSPENLLPMFDRLTNHPLTIRVLAGEVASYRPAPGDFDRWIADHPGFNPFALPLVQVKSHVLDFALRGLGTVESKVLHSIAAFRMSIAFETLHTLLVGEGKELVDGASLDAVLTRLEDRGLLAWDRHANRYDLHPVVRAAVWHSVSEVARLDLYKKLETHFKSIPEVLPQQVTGLEELAPAIELFYVLVGLERYADAFIVFQGRLYEALMYRLSNGRVSVEMLESLFPDGLEQLPRLDEARSQAFTLRALAKAYSLTGQLGRTMPLHRRLVAFHEARGEGGNVSIALTDLAGALFQSGKLRAAEEAAYRALLNTRSREHRDQLQEALSLQWLGRVLSIRGEMRKADVAFQRAVRLVTPKGAPQCLGVIHAALAQKALWLGDWTTARSHADNAWELAGVQAYTGDFIQAARLQGAAALGMNDLDAAEERLRYALIGSRAIDLVEEELPALNGWAELKRRQSELQFARELLVDVGQPAERGNYPLCLADAYNLTVQIEMDAGHPEAAREAATLAYRMAWCDGPPFAYQLGLATARRYLTVLGVQEPADLPPYQDSQYIPMPSVLIDPLDDWQQPG